MLKVGELAKRSGLTVRTLHHYDSIGLLMPSARSDAGYRLYNRDDIARLHQIQAMRRFGMALADIGTFLASPDASLTAIIAQQIHALDQQMAEAAHLRTQLTQLHRQLQQGEQPELAIWLTTLEQMTMYDNYFSKEELSRLPMYHDRSVPEEWATLVADVQQLMDAGLPPQNPSAQNLARRWMARLERDSGNNPAIMARLDAMWHKEPAMQQQSGISPAMRQYIIAAQAESKLSLYAKYMLPDELDLMRRHFQTRGQEWPGLIAAIRAQIAADPSPQAPPAIALAKRWFELFTDMVGSHPDARLRFRTAHDKESALQNGRLMTDDLLDFLRQAISHA